MPTVYRKVFLDETEEELSRLTRQEVTYDLSDKEMTFCELYVKNYNIKHAAVGAGYSDKSSHIVGWKLRQRPRVNRYICWLKLKVSKACHISAMDVIDQYAKIAFSDITDFVEFNERTVKLKDSRKIDGQIIKQVKQGREGISVELHDKLRALEKIEHYFDIMPKDWKQKLEEKKVELMERKLELEVIKAGLAEEEHEDDGFLSALKQTAKEVWKEEATYDSKGDEDESDSVYYEE